MKKWLKILLITSISIILILTASFFIFVSSYYKADDTALNLMGAILQEVVDLITILLALLAKTKPTNPKQTGLEK